MSPKFNEINTSTYNDLIYKLYKSSNCFGIISAKPFPMLCKFPLFVQLGEIEVDFQTNYKTVCLTEKQLIDIKEFHFFLFNDILEIVKPFFVLDNDENKETLFNVPLNADLDYNIDFEIIKNNKSLVNKTIEPTLEQKMNLVVNDETYLGKIISPWYRYEETVSIFYSFCAKI